MTKGILYYSDNRLNMKLALTCRKFIARSGLPITSVTLKPTKFGNNINLPLERSFETLYKQILVGLMAMMLSFLQNMTIFITPPTLILRRLIKIHTTTTETIGLSV